MGFEFFGRKKKTERRLMKQKELAEKARRFEGEAALSESIARQKQRIKVAKRAKFESSPTFTAIENFKTGVGKLQKRSRGRVGSAETDIFLGTPQGFSADPRKRKKKRTRQDDEDSMSGDLGTDQFF